MLVEFQPGSAAWKAYRKAVLRENGSNTQEMQDLAGITNGYKVVSHGWIFNTPGVTTRSLVLDFPVDADYTVFLLRWS